MSPIMLDLAGYELSPEEKEILAHPLVGGVIFFTRNYHDPQQVAALATAIRQHAHQQVLIAVDHEGGRVQRFRDGFSAIPAMGSIREKYPHNIEQACQAATTFGWLMASEVQACNIDISFAPVLDIRGISDVIGDRGFSHEPDELVTLASAFIRGMHQAGMKSTGKHFPGHGSVKEDSHVAMPVDDRDKSSIFALDMAIFEHIHKQQLLDAVMPAHVIYPDVDALPAGFSRVWIQQVLRQQLNFDGVVFSDDLSMQGATQIGGFTERAAAALEAGCDMALVCNNPKGAVEILDNLSQDYINEASQTRLQRLCKSYQQMSFGELKTQARWNEAQHQLEAFYAG
ncbi:beta-N-acetylhexosaminidase [Alteromonas sp. a30]|uniref:beta-N-acetylhexosaminidase n=1 Tax=Alteromonas sp. a30 TaxID=2730917 RepID=UPI002282EAF8|nr:beta-N-acetylhexosaminidase [Alteromonas sp. a30]MCY7297077.1 beta-N-acetylhexosaminidase [Alteromonas sp. a30]